MWGEKGSWLSMVISRFCAVTDGEIYDLSRKITRFWDGDESPGMYSRSVLLGLIFSWLAAIHVEMLVRHAEIFVEAWVSEGGKEKMSWLLSTQQWYENLCADMTSLREWEYRENRRGPSTEACGTPVENLQESYVKPLHVTWYKCPSG